MILLSIANYSTVAFCNYPTILSSITSNFKQYGSYRTVEPFDLPIQNTIMLFNVLCMI